ncbi:MAG: phytanoyl-CoA dioxygenase family protein, partial [Actinomycetota bacterium]
HRPPPSPASSLTGGAGGAALPDALLDRARDALAMSDTASPRLLTTAQMASFVARGFLRLDAVVPDSVNEPATAELETILATWGSTDRPNPPATLQSLDSLYPAPSAIGRMLEVPEVRGALHSLVGPDAVFDHDVVHRREAGDPTTQWLHADAIIDPNLAFDVQLFYMPHAIAPGEGGTRFVPGSHFRQVNEADVGRYQHIVGEEQFSGPAGSVLLFHHGLWHGAMPNTGERPRLMYKIRLNPVRPQVRLWDTSDLDAMQNGPEDHLFAEFRLDSVAAVLRSVEPWYEQGTDRLEYVHRTRLWRYLSGDDDFDVDYYVTRVERKQALLDG